MIYAVSDLHGCPIEDFMRLLVQVNFSDKDFLYVLGDVIDRGKDSVKILKWMMIQPNVQLIKGNHEAMMCSADFLFEEITQDAIDKLNGTKLCVYSNWMANGGDKTLEALQTLRKEEMKDIIEYIKEAPLYETVSVNDRNFLLTHSGLNNFENNKNLSEYEPEDFLWTRPELGQKYFDDIFMVFGHTPTLYYGEECKGKAIKTDTWINIDAGCAFALPPMLLRLDDMKEIYIDKNA